MRVFLKIIMVLLGIASFFAMAGCGVLWAYGQYGVPIVEEQIQSAEAQIEHDLENEYPGSEVDIEFKEVLYKIEGYSAQVAFEVDAKVSLGGIVTHEETNYAVIDVMSVISGSAQYSTYDQGEWDAISNQFTTAPKILFDASEAKNTAITYLVISAVVFVGSIVVNAVFLRKKSI